MRDTLGGNIANEHDYMDADVCMGPICRDFGTVRESELLAASLALVSIDHVLILGKDPK